MGKLWGSCGEVVGKLWGSCGEVVGKLEAFGVSLTGHSKGLF